MRERGRTFVSPNQKKEISKERSTFVGVYDSSKLCRNGSNSFNILLLHTRRNGVTRGRWKS
ncbi:unnamed protein product [Brassica oleracea]